MKKYILTLSLSLIAGSTYANALKEAINDFDESTCMALKNMVTLGFGGGASPFPGFNERFEHLFNWDVLNTGTAITTQRNWWVTNAEGDPVTSKYRTANPDAKGPLMPGKSDIETGYNKLWDEMVGMALIEYRARYIRCKVLRAKAFVHVLHIILRDGPARLEELNTEASEAQQQLTGMALRQRLAEIGRERATITTTLNNPAKKLREAHDAYRASASKAIQEWDTGAPTIPPKFSPPTP